MQRGEDGVYQFTPQDTVTAQFGPNISIKNLRYEVWDGTAMIGRTSVEESITTSTASVIAD